MKNALNRGLAMPAAMFAAALSAVLAGACDKPASLDPTDSSAFVVQNGDVATVTISPSSQTIAAGATVKLTATARDAAGAIVRERPVTWTSGNADAAEVNATGVVRGRAAGIATIRARIGDKTGEATITVIAATTTPPTTPRTEPPRTEPPKPVTPPVEPPKPVTPTVPRTEPPKPVTPPTVTPPPVQESVAAITIVPGTVTLVAGNTLRLVASMTNVSGAALKERVVTWSSSNTAVATIEQSGVLKAIAAGTATITATSGGRTATAQVTVTAGTIVR